MATTTTDPTTPETLDRPVKQTMHVQYFVALFIIIVGMILVLTAAMAPIGFGIVALGVIWWVGAWALHKMGG